MRFSRRQRVRIAESVIAGVSSIWIGSDGDLAAHLHELVEFPLADVAAADAVAGDARLLGQQAGGELLGAHFQREHRDAALRHRVRDRRAGRPPPSPCAAPNAILVASAVFPMPGRPARISRSDGCIPPILASKSRKPVDRPETPPARWKARSAPRIASVSARLKVTKPPLAPPSEASSNSDCSAASICFGPSSSGVGAEGVVHHRLADVDQLPAQPRIMDRAAILAGIDDADHRGEELREIGGAADLLQHAGMLELALQGHGVGELPRLDAPRDGLEDAAVDRVGEMVGGEELADPLIGLVVGQQRAEQGLLGLDVGGRQALGEPQKGRIDAVHGSQHSPPPRATAGVRSLVDK